MSPPLAILSTEVDFGAETLQRAMRQVAEAPVRVPVRLAWAKSLGMRMMGNTGKVAILVLLVCAMAVGGCGRRKQVTTTTTTTTYAAPAAITAEGVAGVSASGNSSNATASAAPGSSNLTVPARTSGDTRTGRLMLAGAITGLGAAAATEFEAVNGAAALSGQQCANPFGGPAANGEQAICSRDSERLQCQCTDTGCQLVPTGIFSCNPPGGLVR